ncbi:Fic family protein [Fundicoccus culcitae]|uniref:Fic family protein n=1 Tax=Fundicoccus culcitae TaxID=2969821 RepID=A0ABY5P9C0_9LACT|nr:Fic family protein [Fundicoccus culcitae]UUX35269.1 Fic family protein [Fundicoccus culcitae]
MHKRLRIISYEDYGNFDDIYLERFHSPSSYITELTMYLFSTKTEARITDKEFNIFFVTIADMLPLIEQIFINSKELVEIGDDLPVSAHSKIIMNLLISEIKSTNDIEGVKSTRKEINKAVMSDKKIRFSGIVNLYKAIIEGKIIKINTLNDFRAIFDELVLDEIDDTAKPDGELFRKEAVYITSDLGTKKIHQGEPTEDRIHQKLLILIEFMNLDDISFLFKAIITHYYFEYIHPFYDGNGRMGRFLLSIYLSRKLDVYTGLSVS